MSRKRGQLEVKVTVSVDLLARSRLLGVLGQSPAQPQPRILGEYRLPGAHGPIAPLQTPGRSSSLGTRDSYAAIVADRKTRKPSQFGELQKGVGMTGRASSRDHPPRVLMVPECRNHQPAMYTWAVGDRQPRPLGNCGGLGIRLRENQAKHVPSRPLSGLSVSEVSGGEGAEGLPRTPYLEG